MEDRQPQVLCTPTHDTTGCLHPVDWHTGPGTPAPDCDCCSWRQNDPGALRPEPIRTSPPNGWSEEDWYAMPRWKRREALRGNRRALAEGRATVHKRGGERHRG